MLGEQESCRRACGSCAWQCGCMLTHTGACGAQHKLSMALKEFRVMHAAASRGNLPHHQLIYPPSLRYLPIWTLGALARQHAAIGGKV